DAGVTQADLVAGIDNGSVANGCRVGQIAYRNIGAPSNSGVVGAGGVAEERTEPTGDVLAAGGVVLERQGRGGGVVVAGGVVLERTGAASGVLVAGGVVLERTSPDSRVVAATDYEACLTGHGPIFIDIRNADCTRSGHPQLDLTRRDAQRTGG